MIPNLFLYILVRRGGNDGETDKKDVSLRIAEWTEPVVVFLAGSIKQPQCVRLPANHHSHSIVVKHLQTNQH